MDRCCSVFVVVEAHLDHTLEKPIHSTRHLDFPWDVQYGFCTFSTFKREDLRTN